MRRIGMPIIARTLAAGIALTAATAAVASTYVSRAPLEVVLTSENNTSLPAPGRPNARVVLSISQPRPRHDGYLVSRVRVREIRLPRSARSYFIRVDFGPHHKYLCDEDGGSALPRCSSPFSWVYSREKLTALRRFDGYAEVFIWVGGPIWSVAGGYVGGRDLVPPRGG